MSCITVTTYVHTEVTITRTVTLPAGYTYYDNRWVTVTNTSYDVLGTITSTRYETVTRTSTTTITVGTTYDMVVRTVYTSITIPTTVGFITEVITKQVVAVPL